MGRWGGSRKLNRRTKQEQARSCVGLVFLKVAGEEFAWRGCKISEKTWDELWSEWCDCRQQIGWTLHALDTQQAQHIENLETALEIIAVVGKLHNRLQRMEQKEFLHYVVERVIVDDNGKVTLKLRSPVAYHHNVTEEVQLVKARHKHGKTKRRGYSRRFISRMFDCCWGKWNQVEHPHHLNTLYFTHRIEFPQRELLTEMTAIHS